MITYARRREEGAVMEVQDSRASADRDASFEWPTGWASMIGALLFALPYLLGVLDGLGVSGAKAPELRTPAFFAMAMGAGLLLIGLYGWWTLARTTLART